MSEYLIRKTTKDYLVDKIFIRKELTRILTSFFGPLLKERIDQYYESDRINELIELADHMLTGYMGKENAHKMLKKVIKEV